MSKVTMDKTIYDSLIHELARTRVSNLFAQCPSGYCVYKFTPHATYNGCDDPENEDVDCDDCNRQNVEIVKQKYLELEFERWNSSITVSEEDAIGT